MIAWARPGSRQGCGHTQCRRYTIASSAALIGADVALVGLGATPAGIAHPRLLVAAGCVIAAAGLVLGLWPHPRQDNTDLEALIRATREDIPDHVPAEWTGENS